MSIAEETKKNDEHSFSSMNFIPGESCVAMLELDLSERNLNSLEELESYIYLHHLNLRFNRLKSISVLQKFKHLKILDCSHNLISLQDISNLPSDLICFKANDNKINDNDMESLNSCQHLREIHLAYNNLTHLNHFKRFQALHTLSLNGNKMNNSLQFPSIPLRILELNHSNIQNLNGIEVLKNTLEKLLVRSNGIKDLSPLQNFPRLMEIDIRENSIGSLNHLQWLSNNHLLADLNLMGNPCSTYDDENERKELRYETLYLLPQLNILNDQEATAEEKIAGENNHGAEKEEREAIRKKYL
eukprot:gb/GECH01008889.1/.p1 GENE.gb/GECH01008889.1/~~gb/GECH01008889.1/.p1  ORF type:complete len:301 (+),score=59.64 gb/GECH01008889.1/:1-903(+)